MNTFTSTIRWLEIDVSIVLPALRWPALVWLSLIALCYCLVFLFRNMSIWVAAIGSAVAAGGFFLIVMFEIPACDILELVPEARFETGSMIAARDLGIVTAVAGLYLGISTLASRRRPVSVHQVLGGVLSVIIGVAVVWVETAPIAQLIHDVFAVGAVPGPSFQLLAYAHVGLPVERVPGVVHRALEDAGPAFFHPGWKLDVPVRIVPPVVDTGRAIVHYSLGPVRLAVPVLTHGYEDRGPRAWPLAIGDELRLGPAPTANADETYRVLRNQIDNGFRIFVIEVSGPAHPPRTEYIVRRDGGLYRVNLDRKDHDGNIVFDNFELLLEPEPGKCLFERMTCPCNPKMVACSWISEGTAAGKVASTLLGITTFGVTALLDLPLGKTTSGDVYVLSHTGPGAP